MNILGLISQLIGIKTLRLTVDICKGIKKSYNILDYVKKFRVLNIKVLNII